MDVTFHFDPICPWTWRTSRWLVQVADMRGLAIGWAPFSLAIINEGKIPEHFRAPMEASGQALRLVAALRSTGRHDEIRRFYTEIGERTHERGAILDENVAQEAAMAAGLHSEVAVLSDPAWDEAVRSAHEEAYASAGPDVGSPVITAPKAARGLHGPILAEVPDPQQSLMIWDSIDPLLHSGTFFEVKRGRR